MSGVAVRVYTRLKGISVGLDEACSFEGVMSKQGNLQLYIPTESETISPMFSFLL